MANVESSYKQVLVDGHILSPFVWKHDGKEVTSLIDDRVALCAISALFSLAAGFLTGLVSTRLAAISIVTVLTATLSFYGLTADAKIQKYLKSKSEIPPDPKTEDTEKSPPEMEKEKEADLSKAVGGLPLDTPSIYPEKETTPKSDKTLSTQDLLLHFEKFRLNNPNDQGFPPLHLALKAQDRVGNALKLVEGGAELSTPDRQGLPAFSYAMNCSPEVREFALGLLREPTWIEKVVENYNKRKVEADPTIEVSAFSDFKNPDPLFISLIMGCLLKEKYLIGAIKFLIQPKEVTKAIKFFNDKKWEDLRILLETTPETAPKGERVFGNLFDEPKVKSEKPDEKSDDDDIRGWGFWKSSIQLIDDGDGDWDTPDNKDTDLSLLTPEKEKELLSRNDIVGLPNQGNDCFFNALSQVIMHSPMLNAFLLDESNLQLNKNKEVDKEAKEFYKFWRDLNLKYHLEGSSPSSKEVAKYSHSNMRKLLGFSSWAQQDSTEALKRMLNYYKPDKILIQHTVTDYFDIEKKKKHEKAKDCSQLNPDGTLITSDKVFWVEIPLANEDLETILDKTFHHPVNEKMEDKRNFRLGDDSYYVEEIMRKTELTDLKDEIFIFAKRFQGNKTIKDSTPLNLNGKNIFTIKEKKYQLSSFVVHIGSAGGGHYVSYCLVDGQWIYFNDSSCTKIDEAAAMEAAKNMYLFNLKRVPDQQ